MPGFFVGGSGGFGSITKKTGDIVEAWYEAFKREDYDVLLAFFPDDLYQKISREQMRGIFASYRAKLGSIMHYKINFAKENHTGDQGTYMLQFKAQYERAESHDTFHIVQNGMEPVKITKVEFDSPA